jgi:KUP system potassium uptake protein
MGITTVLVYQVARRHWGWSRRTAVLAFGAMLAVDLMFFAANLAKVVDGGWLPLAFGAVVFTLMATWQRGRELLAARRDREGTALTEVVASMATPVTQPKAPLFSAARP